MKQRQKNVSTHEYTAEKNISETIVMQETHSANLECNGYIILKLMCEVIYYNQEDVNFFLPNDSN